MSEESDYRKTESEKEIDRKLDALKRAVVMMAKGKYYIDDITAMLEDLDEAWDKG